MSKAGFEEIEHTADWALRVWADDLAGLLRAAAQGMIGLLDARAEGIDRRWHAIHFEAEDPEGLLVGWLEELLFLLETEGETCTSFDLSIGGEFELSGRVELAPAARPKKHIKAVTYHNLRVERSEEGFETVVVFDV